MLSTPLTRVRVALKGLGIAPELRVDPEGTTTSGLDFGDVFSGESSEQKLTVTNVRSSLGWTKNEEKGCEMGPVGGDYYRPTHSNMHWDEMANSSKALSRWLCRNMRWHKSASTSTPPTAHLPLSADSALRIWSPQC